MGVLSQAALGGVAGLGQGLANVGHQQAQEAMRADEERRRAAADEERQNRIDQRIGMREDMRAGRAGSSGSGSGRGGAAGPGALDIAGDPEKLALLGGMDRGEADEYVRMQKGGVPQGENVRLEPGRFQNPDRMDEAGPGRDQLVPKYTPGDAAGMRDRAIKALYQAMKLSDPSHSDQLSKSQTEDAARGLSEDYLGGNDRAGSAALNMRGKATSGSSGNLVTGAVPAGSVAASIVDRNEATAGKADREAVTRGPIRDQLNAIEQQRKQIASDRADVKAQEAALKDQLGPDATAQRKALAKKREAIDVRASELDGQSKTLTKRLMDLDSASPTPPRRGALAVAGEGGAPGPTRVSPATQAGRDGDSVTIMRSELAAEQARLAKLTDPDDRTRKQIDIDSIQKEIDRMTRRSGSADAGSAEAPPANLLKEGTQTRFKNGQVWTLRSGKPVRVT